MRTYDRGVRHRLNELKEYGYALVSIFPTPPYNEASETLSIDEFLAQIERGERENLDCFDDACGLDFTRGIMLYEDIKDENGWIRRENKYYLRVYLPADTTLFVNVYEVTRHFGGYEEGGWWYDWFECLQSVPVSPKDAEKMADYLTKKYSDRAWGDIRSIAGAIGGGDIDGSQELPYVWGADIVVRVEREPAESQTKEVPTYS